MTGTRFKATICRLPDGQIRIYVTRGDKEPLHDGTIVEVLHGDDQTELRERAVKYVRECM